MLPDEMNAGLQPLDTLIESAGLKNHDLVAARAALNLTHKEISKARKGRKLSSHTQRRVLAALNDCLTASARPAVALDAAFNYRGR